MSWDTKLAEAISLRGVDQPLLTLRDAALFLTQRFPTLRSGMLTGAVEDLMTAADDPSADQVRQATFQLVRLLQEENLLQNMPASLGLLAQEKSSHRLSRMVQQKASRKGSDRGTRS